MKDYKEYFRSNISFTGTLRFLNPSKNVTGLKSKTLSEKTIKDVKQPTMSINEETDQQLWTGLKTSATKDEVFVRIYI